MTMLPRYFERDTAGRSYDVHHPTAKMDRLCRIGIIDGPVIGAPHGDGQYNKECGCTCPFSQGSALRFELTKGLVQLPVRTGVRPTAGTKETDMVLLGTHWGAGGGRKGELEVNGQGELGGSNSGSSKSTKRAGGAHLLQLAALVREKGP